MAAIYSLFITDKSGGLLFYGRDGWTQMIACGWQVCGIQCMQSISSPTVGSLSIELLEADTFDLHCFQLFTGTKLCVVCEPGNQHMEGLLKLIYELDTDYILKNPFYEMEMPIHCELFDLNLSQAIQKDDVAIFGR